MKIEALAENVSNHKDLGCEHGLSLYIETKKHKLLFDTGASGLFAENAVKMKIDLSAVDIAIISHGHYDHGGGLKTFLSLNSQAKVYFSKSAFEMHYANFSSGDKKYVGLDETLLPNPRFVFVGDTYMIDEDLELFSNVKGSRLNPSGNSDLLTKNGETYKQDDFTHEQNLVIRENGKNVLIAGCAHRGIVNIIEHFIREKELMPNVVIGGFHLYNAARDENESPAIVDEIGEYLANTKAKLHTCHCTGLVSYERLKTVIGDNIGYLSTGCQIII